MTKHFDTAVPSPAGWMNIADAIFNNARRRPRHPALIEGERTISYAELATLVSKTAGALQGIGLKQGDVLGLALGDDADHAIAMLAAAWMGAIILPMDVRWTTEEKRRIAAHFGARLVFVPDGEAALPGIETVPADQAWTRRVAESEGAGSVERRRDMPLLLSLSSGTTGTPKGPLVTHGHVLNRYLIYTISLTFNEADRFMTATPMYFGAGRFMTLCYLFLGATVVLFPPPYRPEELVQALQAQRINAVFLVPTLLRGLVDLPRSSTPLLPGLRLLVSSGSSLYPEERRKILQEVSPNFFNFYSCTEGGGVSLLRPEDPDAVSTSVGKIVFGSEVQIVDNEHNMVPVGTSGHIRYRGATVASSFYRNEEESAKAFRDGWYYPGDLGRFDDDGYLYLTGRAKDMIIRGGVNIYPPEIEQTLMAHPAVAEAAVIGWPSKVRGEEVAAFVVRRGEVGEQELMEHVGASLARYKVPRSIFFVEALPKSGMGKVLKLKLAERLPAIE